MQGNLGKRGAGMGKVMRTFNSIAAVHTVSTTLLFTVLASITDLSGIAVRMKEAQNLGDFFKETMRAGRDSIKKDGYFEKFR